MPSTEVRPADEMMEFVIASPRPRGAFVMELVELVRELDLTATFTAVVLVLARVTPLVTLTPFLGGPALSPSVRTVVALALVVALYPSATAGMTDVALGAPLLLVLMLKEAVIGLALGLLAAVAFHTLSMTGQLVDRARGGAMSRVSDPLAGGESSPLASLHLQLGVVVFLVAGGHRAFLAAVAGSYDLLPLTSLPVAPAGVQATALLSARLLGGALAAAMLLAAPAVTAVMVTDLALGMLGRAAPQLGTYFMAMPLRAAVGLMMTLFALTLVVGELMPQLLGLAEWVERAAALVRTGP